MATDTGRGRGGGAVSRKVEIFILGDSRSAQKAFRDLEKTAGGSDNRLEQLSKRMTKVGDDLTKKVTLPIVGLGMGAAKAFIDFESSFAGVRKTVDASEAEFDALAGAFRQMALEIPLSVNEINAIGEAAGQLGIKNENIVGFTRVMADLGVATNMSSEEAATALARLANITQMPQTEFDRLGSSVVALGNNFATTESEIVEMGLRIAAAGSQVGMTEPQILGVAAALSSLGIQAQAGGTAISKVLIDIAQQVDTGGDKLELLARTAGMTVEEFQQAFRDNAVGALEAFVMGLGRTEEAGGSLFGTLQELGYTEVRMRDALLRLAGGGDILTRSVQMSTDAWDENIALTEEAEQRYGTLESKLQLAKNALYDAGITLGETLAPKLVQGAEAVARLVQAFADLPAPAQNAVLGIAAVAAAAGPVMSITGRLLGAWTSLQKAFAAVSGARAAAEGLSYLTVAQQRSAAIAATNAKGLSGVSNAMAGVGASATSSMKGVGALATVFSPAGLLVAGLAAAAAGALLVKRNVDQMQEATDSAAEAAPKLAESMGLAFDAIEQGADNAAASAMAADQSFTEMNANAVAQLRNLQSEVDRGDYLLQIGWELVQHGATAAEAFDAIQRLARAAGIEVPVDVTVEGLSNAETQLESVARTAQRVARETEANWLGVGTATKETINGVASAAADAFQMGEVDQAIARIVTFENEIRNSGASIGEQQVILNQLNDAFLVYGVDVGISTANTYDFSSAMHQLTNETASTTGAQRELIGIYRDAISAGSDHETALALVADRQRELALEADAAAAATGDAGTAAGDAVGPTGDLADAQGALADELDGTTESTEDLIDAQQAYLDQARAATNPIFALTSALDGVEDAQADYTEAVKEHGRRSPEAERAALALAQAVGRAEDAALDGELSYEAFRAKLQQWVRDGHLTERQADAIRRRVEEARGSAEAFEDRYEATIEADDRRANLAFDGVERRAQSWQQRQSEGRLILNARDAHRQLDDIIARATATRTMRVNIATSGGVGTNQFRPRAGGGRVWPRETFLVGEEGPELVEFDGHGNVIDAASTRRALAGAGARTSTGAMPAASPRTVVNNTITVQAHDVAEAARKLSETLGWEALKAGGWN